MPLDMREAQCGQGLDGARLLTILRASADREDARAGHWLEDNGTRRVRRGRRRQDEECRATASTAAAEERRQLWRESQA